MKFDINKRISLLREELNLSQTDFGKQIGVSRGVISNIDLNVVDAATKPLMIQQICKTYGINRTWLETGEGEMFVPQTRDEELALLFGELIGDPDDSFKKRFISAMLELDESAWGEVEKFCRKLLDGKEDG